ncbi:MAG TPA: hypothetical protein VFB66_16270 [Tepidisphaeraceae bacterium]|nr:hypothetical protein [Tepidisphaeraceae bacterium]
MLKELGSGLVGALALTAVHETAKRTIPHAPRMDVIGRRGIAKPLYAMGVEPPHGDKLQAAALTGDILSNSLFYSLVALGDERNVVKRGLILGLLAGLGAALLPPVMGLGRQPGHRGLPTHLMTIAWYTIGGVVAAATLKALRRVD